MSPQDAGSRLLERQIQELLAEPDPGRVMLELQPLPRRRVMAALQSILCSPDEILRWRAVVVLARVAADLAGEDPEAGRTVIRRQVWNLNDESGNCAWGAPELMAELMARHRGLADEFAHLLVSFITPEGLYLDYGPLLRSAVWGIARLAETRPELLAGAPDRLLPLLDSPDPGLRGLAARALGRLRANPARSRVRELRTDPAAVAVFEGWELRQTSVGELAAEALAAIGD